ncbi:DUF6671 family protein [Pedobacter nototheniae]|uniref:DUF6671 family protein n=1 Tax=Pedobacter nototheniae TaxID=2488994 RepID=UPI00104092C4|nr:DUF6671 family protein [Pedobacter nototheniae]
MIPKNFVEEVTRKTSIESIVEDYIDLTPIGTQVKGICPFCKNPGFSVSKDKQIYKCFKCGKGGGVISFIQEIEKKSFPAAVQFLADKLGLNDPQSN